MSEKHRQSAAASAGWFTRFANWSAWIVGSPAMFLFAIATIFAWLALGPWLHWSDTWQLIANSWTNIATFLVVFLIQNSQNRDSRAINLKLDEIIRALEPADEQLIDIERLSDEDIERIADRYQRIRDRWEERRGGGEDRRAG
ncbi:MAG: low affinity iron permease family protein [Terriglobales bacterium]